MIRIRVERKAPWVEAEHPRDGAGRFIEVGALVRILVSGATGTVTRNVGGGRIEVARSDGRHVIVHRTSLMVLKRPDGSAPSTHADAAPVAAPVQPPSPTAEPIADDAKPVYDEGVGNRATPTPQEEIVYEPTDAAVTAAAHEPLPSDAHEAVTDAAAPGGNAAPEANDIEPIRTTYDFPTAYEADAIASIDKANRRAERAGITDRIGYTTRRYEVKKNADRNGNLYAIPRVEQRTELTLDRPTVQHDGWTFVATLTWDPEAGLVTRVAPNATLQARPEARQCDVCKSQRDRKDTYVVQREGKEMQVGSNCLNQFMGIKPAGLWMLGFEPDVKENGDELGSGGFGGDSRVDSQWMLALALAITKARGWVSRSNAGYDRQPTADVIREVLNRSIPKNKPFYDQMEADAAGNLDDAHALLDFARTIDGDSEYATNLRAVASGQSVDDRNIPLLASAIAAKNARDQKVAEETAAKEVAAQSDHIGSVGDKIKDHPARVTGVRYIDGNYGVTTLITMVDPDGNVLKWFASGSHDEVEVGDDVTVAGTIKKHDQFRGVNETVLTRAKVARTAAAQAAQDQKEQERAAAEKAAAEERAAAADVVRTRIPDGYVPITPDPNDPLTGALLFPGVTVRVDMGNGKYADGLYVAAGGDGHHYVRPDDKYLVTPFPLDRVVAAAPASRQDPATNVPSAQEAQQFVPIPAGFTKRPDTPEPLHVGTTVRMYNSRNGSYFNAVIVSISEGDNPTIIVELPDGTRQQTSRVSIDAYQPVPVGVS